MEAARLERMSEEAGAALGTRCVGPQGPQGAQDGRIPAPTPLLCCQLGEQQQGEACQPRWAWRRGAEFRKVPLVLTAPGSETQSKTLGDGRGPPGPALIPLHSSQTCDLGPASWPFSPKVSCIPCSLCPRGPSCHCGCVLCTLAPVCSWVQPSKLAGCWLCHLLTV